MGLSKEAIEQVVNFHPKNGVEHEKRVDLGEVDGGLRLVHGNFPYMMKAIGDDGIERFIGKKTTQPVLGLEREGELVATLAYHSDVRTLPEQLALTIVNRVTLSSLIPGG